MSRSILVILVLCVLASTSFAVGAVRERQLPARNLVAASPKQYPLAVPSPKFLSTEVASNCSGVEAFDAVNGSTMWMYIIICTCLVIFGGLMSGLTVGFMSIDRLKLNVIKEAGTLEEVDMVERVGPILENHHLLLVTLLLCNALAMEALPIFLDRLVPSVVAVILSVTFVLIFGEIVPQAYCTSNPLKICASAAWLVRLLQLITYPISFPFARLLDRVLGDHSAHVLFKRSELTALIKLHSSEGSGLSITHGPLKHDEANVIRGALETGNRKATDVMTKMQHVCMLEIDRIMDMNTLAEILGMGHSRIPVFHKSRHNIKGLLLVKRLIVCNPDDHRPLYHFVHRKPIVVTPDIGLYELLNVFQTGRSHMAIVTEHTREYHWAMSTGEDVPGYCRIQGVVTLEDVIEQLIQEEIQDEVDNTTMASHRPFEKFEDRAEYRTAGLQRAFNVFKAVLSRFRNQKLQRYLSRGQKGPTTQPVDPSHFHMSDSGDLVYDVADFNPGTPVDTSSTVSFADLPNPDGDNMLSPATLALTVPAVRGPSSSFGSFRPPSWLQPRSGSARGDLGGFDSRSEEMAAKLESLMAEQNAAKKLRAMAAQGKKPHAFISATTAVKNTVAVQSSGRRVYHDSDTKSAGPASASKTRVKTPSSVLPPPLGLSFEEIYDTPDHRQHEISEEVHQDASESQLPRISNLAQHIISQHSSHSAPSSPHHRASTPPRINSIPASPLLLPHRSDGEAENDDHLTNIDAVVAAGGVSTGPYLSASAFDLIAKSSHERGMQKKWKEQQRQALRRQRHMEKHESSLAAVAAAEHIASDEEPEHQ